MKKNYYFYIGTTAELIKLAPVIKRFKEERMDFKIIYSGQVKINFEEFEDYVGEIKPDISFKGKGADSSVFKFSLWAVRTFIISLTKLREKFRGLNKNKTYIIVHGDTVSSLIGAMVGKLYGFKVVHIEAGLRSFNFLEPFPEEISRYIISRLADIHFCPNDWACNNIKNIRGKKINTEQNTLVEYFDFVIKNINKEKRKIKDKYFVLVVHRQEHVIFRKQKTKELLKNIFRNIDNKLYCVFLVHDISADFVESIGFDKEKIIYQERLPYKDFMELIYHSEFMITDGGSNQEEMYYMGKPALILRNVTERIEGLDSNILLSKNKIKNIVNFLRDYKSYQEKPIKVDVCPSVKIINTLSR